MEMKLMSLNQKTSLSKSDTEVDSLSVVFEFKAEGKPSFRLSIDGDEAQIKTMLSNMGVHAVGHILSVEFKKNPQRAL